MEAGAALRQCMIVEIFAGTGRVTAALKHFGMSGAFGTDHKRHKMAIVVLVVKLVGQNPPVK